MHMLTCYIHRGMPCESNGKPTMLSTEMPNNTNHGLQPPSSPSPSAKLQISCCLFGLECAFPVATQADKSRGLSEFANCEGG